MHSLVNHDQSFRELQSTSENKEWIYKTLADNLSLDAVRFTREYIGGEKKLRKRIFLSFAMKNNTMSRFLSEY